MTPTLEALVKYPFMLLTGFLVTFVTAPLVIRLAPALGLMDRPRGRHAHRAPTPTGGGVAVFLGFHAACAALFLLPWTPFVGALDLAWWLRVLALSVLVVALGLTDDRLDLRPGAKLAGQVLIGARAWWLDLRVAGILGVTLPPLADAALTILWFAALMNAFNLIDGLDGLAGGLGLIAALGLAGSFLLRHQPADVLVLLGLVGACAAFLRYNFHPARLFLGDGGSLFLGFVLAAVAVRSGAKGTALTTIAVPVLVVGVPLFDTFLAVWRRSVRRVLRGGEAAAPAAGVFSGDADHLHHRLLRAGLSQPVAAAWLYAAALFLVAVGLLSMTYHWHAMGIYILAFVAVSYVVVRQVAQVELWDSGMALARGLTAPPRRALAVVVYPLLDVLVLAAALALAAAVAGRSLTFMEFKRWWLDQAPLWVGLPFLCLFGVRAYQRVWARARVSEYVLLGLALTVGILAAAGLSELTSVWSTAELARQTVMYTGLALGCVAGLRALPRAAADAMAWFDQRARTDAAAPRALVAGAGDRCTLLLIQQGLQAGRSDTPHIVGLVDPDPNLHGRFVHGQRVLGGLEMLPELARRHGATLLIVADLPEGAPLAACRDAAREGGLTLLRYVPRLEDLGAGT